MKHRHTSNSALSELEELRQTWGTSGSPVLDSPLQRRWESDPTGTVMPGGKTALPEVRSLSCADGISPALSVHQAAPMEQQQQQSPAGPSHFAAFMQRLHLGQQGASHAAEPQQHALPAVAAAPAGPAPQGPPDPGFVFPAPPAAHAAPPGPSAEAAAAMQATPAGAAGPEAFNGFGFEAVLAPVALQNPFAGLMAAAAPPPAAHGPFGQAPPAAAAAGQHLAAPAAQEPPAPVAAAPVPQAVPLDPFAGAAAAAPPPAAAVAAPPAAHGPFGGAAAAGALGLAAPAAQVPPASAIAAAAAPQVAPLDLFAGAAAAAPPPTAAAAAPPAAAHDPFGGAAAAAAAGGPGPAALPVQVPPEQFAFAAGPFGGAAAAAAAGPPPAAQAAFNPFGAAAGAAAQPDFNPFGGAAAAAPPDPFGGAAAAPPAAAQAAFNPFGAAAGAAALPDPFAQVAAALPPLPAPPAGFAPPPEADFNEEYAAWLTPLQHVAATGGGGGGPAAPAAAGGAGGGGGGGIVAAAAGAAAAAGPALVLPTHINTCEIGDDGDCVVQIGQELARGSFGSVYPGLYYDDPVAVKMLQVAGFGVDEATLQQRILREVQLQARAVSHSGVVKFVAVCFSPPAIVMEMCACSLSERIINHWATQQAAQPAQQQQQQQQPEVPSWQLVVQLLRQAAAALAFLHRQGQAILHNDLRAANMVLTPSNDATTGPWKLKICDFGLAVAAEAAGAALVPEVTHASWRAPELDQGYNLADRLYTVTPAADVYALGCVLREMLVPSLPQPHFPAADQRLPALADPPPVGLEPLFQACVQQQALDRPNARVVWQRLSHMQVA